MATMRLGAILKRAPSGSDGGGKHKAVIITVSIVAVLVFGIIFFFIFRSLRFPKQADAQGRKQRRGRTWIARLKASLTPRNQGHSQLSTIEVQNVPNDPEAGVNRHTSIRSIMTLPAYSAIPHVGEGVIAREGDREGMDTVVEFPETVEEEEVRREEEMESLWRIRQQRREEAAEREDRRRRRREARARGDTVTLNAIRHESFLRTTYQQNNGSNAMISEHHSRPRERRVSAVSYADLGVARHDGSRVRANSNESDNRPLLDGAAGTGMGGPVRPWVSGETLSTHHRMASATSLLSMSSFDSDERPGTHREESDLEVVSLQQTRSRALSRSQSQSISLRRPSTQMQSAVDADLGENRIPLPDPPQYDSVGFEEAPPYEETHPEGASQSLDERPSRSIDDREPQPDERENVSSPPQLPAIDRLPSIRISEPSIVEPPNPVRLASARTAPTPTIHEETT